MQSTAASERRTSAGASGAILLGVACASSALFAIHGPGTAGGLLFPIASGLAAATIVVGVLVNRPVARGAWLAIALSLLMVTIGNLIVISDRSGLLPGTRGLADALFMTAYAPLFLAAIRLGRGPRRSDATSFLDTAIVGLASVPLVWELVVKPYVPDAVPDATSLFALSIPVVDIALLALVAPLLFLRYARSASAILLIAGFVALGTGDSWYAMRAVDGQWSSGPEASVAWLLAYVLLGAAAIVPSARALGAIRDPQPASRDVTRLVVLGAAVLVPAMAMLIRAVALGSSEMALLASVTLVVSALVVIRLQRTIADRTATEDRFRRFMSHDGVLAVIKDAFDRYVFVNDAAASVLGLAGRDWFGRTDADLFGHEPVAPAIEGQAPGHGLGHDGARMVEHQGRSWHVTDFTLAGAGHLKGSLGLDVTEKVQALDAIRLQARLLASIKDAVILVDAQQTITFWSSGAEAIFGHTEAEALGQSVKILRPPGADVEADAAWARVASGATDLGDLPGRRRDGSTAWVDVRITPVAADEPASAGYLIVAKDVTQRVTAERNVQFQARLLESVRDAVVVTSTDGAITYWNRGAEEIFGYSSEEMIGRQAASTLMAATDEEIRTAWEALLAGSTQDFDWRARRHDGADLWLNARITPLFDESGVVSAYLAVAKDVTRRKAVELDLARLGAAIDHALDAVIVTDEDDRLVYVNPAFEHITGFAFEEVRGVAALDLPSCGAFGRALRQARKAKDVWRGDVVSQRSNGTDLICAAVISPIAIDGHASPGFVTMARDVTNERIAERAGERRIRERMLVAETLSALRAGTDPEETADAICGQLVKLPELAIGTVVTFGHDGIATVLGQRIRGGDALPGLALGRERSDYLRERAASGPWVERWIAPPGHPYADLFARRRISAHAYAPMVIGGEPVGLLIVGSDRRDAIDTLTERLPALLEFSAIATTLLGGAVADRASTARSLADIQSVIADEAFMAVFQPIVELGTGKVRGYEALTRFADGTPPNIRFEEAQRLGAGLELEAAALKVAFAQATTLPAGTWLNVNVSPEAVLAGIVEALIPPESREVVIEITEHQAITDYATFRTAIDPIRDRVQLAIDDAGAGFASLRHIVELAPAMVKLDRSLVAGIDNDQAREAVVAGMVRFAQAAGLVLLAEGIETQDELRALRRLGVELGQGYLLGEPGTIDEVASDPRVTSWSTPTPPRRKGVKAATRRRAVGGPAAVRDPRNPAPAARSA